MAATIRSSLGADKSEKFITMGFHYSKKKSECLWHSSEVSTGTYVFIVSGITFNDDTKLLLRRWRWTE